MKRKLGQLLTVAAVATTALTGGAALAAGGPDDQAEVKAFLAARQTITGAIDAAEAASGGKAVAAEFGQGNGAGVYEVDTIANGKQVSVEIDAMTGKVIATKGEGAVADADDGDIVDPAQLGAPLTDLVARAEQGAEGKVMAISAGHGTGQPATIEVELANADGTTRQFAMAADGTMTKATGGARQEHGEQDEETENAG